MADLRIQWIRNTRLRVGQPPREFDRRERSYLRLHRPSWLQPKKDLLDRIYQDQQLLLRHGSVGWGALVMASIELFERSNQDVPGVIVYCPQPHRHDDLERLMAFAAQIFALKEGPRRTPDEEQLGAWLATETERFFDHPVPSTIAGDVPVRTGCTMFTRKHVPGRVLNNGFFPLFYHPDTPVTLVVPGKFWDPSLASYAMRP